MKEALKRWRIVMACTEPISKAVLGKSTSIIITLPDTTELAMAEVVNIETIPIERPVIDVSHYSNDPFANTIVGNFNIIELNLTINYIHDEYGNQFNAVLGNISGASKPSGTYVQFEVNFPLPFGKTDLRSFIGCGWIRSAGPTFPLNEASTVDLIIAVDGEFQYIVTP